MTEKTSDGANGVDAISEVSEKKPKAAAKAKTSAPKTTKTSASSVPTLRITLVRSVIGRPPDQEATVRSLGLRKLHQTVERPDTPDVRGMVTKVRHMVRVEEAAS